MTLRVDSTAIRALARTGKPTKNRDATASGRTSRPSAGYALPCGHAYRRGGYRLTPSGLRAPARRERQPKPRALSGRGGGLYGGMSTIVGNLLASAGRGWFSGFCFIGFQRLTGRADFGTKSVRKQAGTPAR